MAEIDSLELQVQSEISKVNKDLDALATKLKVVSDALSSVSKKSGFTDVSKKSKEVAESMKDIAQSAQSATSKATSSLQKMAKPMEDVKKSAVDLAKELNEKFKNFTPVIDFSQNQESLKRLSDRYKQQMLSAQNEINRILAASSAESQEKGMERYILRINEAKNGIKAIAEYLDKIEGKKQEPTLHLLDEQEVVDYKKYIENIKEDISALGSLPEGKITSGLLDALKEDFNWLKTNAPKEKQLINDVANAIQSAQYCDCI